jgi:CheY-like chemotaxis protein
MTLVGTPSSSLRILYLEDNAADADLARRALQRQSPAMRMSVAPTLAAALELLVAESPPFDLILSDLRLPDGSGLELLGLVRQRQLPLAFVVLTGSGDQAAALAALKAGADDYLVKSADYLQRLALRLTAAYDRFRTEHQLRTWPLRVLYAEHNPFDVDLARRQLKQQAPQIQLDCVGSAAEVLGLLPASPPEAPPWDLLLLDYQLPGMDGLELAKTLRDERGCELPVVIITGQGSETVVADALRLGVADYLVKHAGYLAELPLVLE